MGTLLNRKKALVSSITLTLILTSEEVGIPLSNSTFKRHIHECTQSFYNTVQTTGKIHEQNHTPKPKKSMFWIQILWTDETIIYDEKKKVW